MAVTLLRRPSIVIGELVTILAASVDSLNLIFIFVGVWVPDIHIHIYSTDDLTKAKYTTSLHCFGQYFRLRLAKLRVLLAFLVLLSTCCPHSNLLEWAGTAAELA